MRSAVMIDRSIDLGGRPKLNPTLHYPTLHCTTHYTKPTHLLMMMIDLGGRPKLNPTLHYPTLPYTTLHYTTHYTTLLMATDAK